MELKSLSGKGCILYYNDYNAIIGINLSNINDVSNTELSNFSLPDGVTPFSDIYIFLPIMTSGWTPNGQIAYILIRQGTSVADIRYNGNQLNSAVITGYYAIPRELLSIT